LAPAGPARVFLRGRGSAEPQKDAGDQGEEGKHTTRMNHHCFLKGLLWGRPALSTNALKASFSFELDRALDLDREAYAFDGQYRFGRQCLVSFQSAAADGRPHRLLDIALRGDADFLEKLAHADVESILIHDRLLKVPER
jgi:hypothetical protein